MSFRVCFNLKYLKMLLYGKASPLIMEINRKQWLIHRKILSLQPPIQ